MNTVIIHRHRVMVAITALLILFSATTAPNPAMASHDVSRYVEFYGRMLIVDDENWPESDEWAWFDVPQTGKVVGRREVPVVYVEECVGDEVRVEVTFSAWAEGSNVRVIGFIRLFEGSVCTTDDLEKEQFFELIIPETVAKGHDGLPIRNADGSIQLEWSDKHVLEVKDGAGRTKINLWVANGPG